jgi:FimV-like protein
MTRALAAALCLVLSGAARADSSDVTAQLLDGVRAFRGDRFDEALVHFRDVERRGGAPDLALYLGPTLYKLGRYAEAQAVLARQHRRGPRDAVADYYLALTYHRLGLTQLARRVFAGLDAREAGPRLAEGAARFVAAIDARVPSPAELPRLLAQADTDDPARAAAALDAAEEALLRATPGSPERLRAATLVARQALAAGAEASAFELLAGETDPRVEVELARAALALGDRGKARALLDDAREHGDGPTRDVARRVLEAGLR